MWSRCFSLFFLSFLLQCWKPFDPQSRVLLIDWCFHTVTLAESPVFRGPRCHSGTNALEFSQIIPLCACLCAVQRWSQGKMESIYLSVSQSVWPPFTNHCLYRRGWRVGGAVTFNVSSWREIWTNIEVGRGRSRRRGMTAKVLTLGDIGTTWHYSLAARWDLERERERGKEMKDKMKR